MTIEKICEYFNDIGILQLENINNFLKIYSQLSKNKYKNKTDKIVLALFSYMTLISKNEQQLYDICKNIINNYSNNLIVYRYKALNLFNNIFKNKVHSNYLLFFSKINSFIFNKKSNIKYIHLFNQKSQRTTKNENKKNIRKKYDKNNYRNNINISDVDKECTFSPRINRYYNSFNMKNNNKKYEIDSSYNHNNFNNNDISLNNKYINFKNSINYGYNNKINNEIEKMLANISKYSNNTNNEKYFPQKTIYRNKVNNFNPSNSYDDNINNNNFPSYLYYDEDYDFYQNEKDHIQKVQDKIMQLKIQKLDKISNECTFSPQINRNTKLSNNMNETCNYLTENNESHRNYIQSKNINNFWNNNFNYKNDSKKENNDDYQLEYYNEYPKKLNKKKRSRTYSDKKNNKEYSIYKSRKEELSKLFKEQCPFMPNINYNKKFKVKSTFIERQEKFLQNKEKLKKQKEEEEKKQIEELNKKYNRTKVVTKDVIARLYNKEAEKIKERLKKEIEEKTKKKDIIDWSKRREKHINLDDYRNNIYTKKLKLNINKDYQKEKNIEEYSNIFNNENCYENNDINFGLSSKNNKNTKENENSHKITTNKNLLIDKTKNEFKIGFKQNFNDKDFLKDNQNSENDKNLNQKENKDKNNKETPDNNYKTGISLNFEEKINNYEQNNLLNDLMNKDGIKSTAFQEMMNKCNVK